MPTALPVKNRKILDLDVKARFIELAMVYEKVSRGKVLPNDWEVYAMVNRKAILDWVCRTTTGFTTFDDLVNAKGGYRPTLRSDLDWRFIPLADAYDAFQAARGDDRVAYRPN